MINWMIFGVAIFPLFGYLLTQCLGKKNVIINKSSWVFMFIAGCMLLWLDKSFGLIQGASLEGIRGGALGYQAAFIYVWIWAIALWMIPETLIHEKTNILFTGSMLLFALLANNIILFAVAWVGLIVATNWLSRYRALLSRQILSFVSCLLAYGLLGMDTPQAFHFPWPDLQILELLPAWKINLSVLLLLFSVLNLSGLISLVKHHQPAPSFARVKWVLVNQGMSLYLFVQCVLPLLEMCSPQIRIALSVGLYGLILFWSVYVHFFYDVYQLFAILVKLQSGLVCLSFLQPNALGVTGGTIQWIVSAVGGLGLGLSVFFTEQRTGVNDMRKSTIGADKMPKLAMMFFIFGMILVDFPGTLGFVGEDLILHGILIHSIAKGLLILSVMASASIAIYRCYISIYLGRKTHEDELRLDLVKREAIGYCVLLVSVVGFGLFPSIFVKAINGTLKNYVSSDQSVKDQKIYKTIIRKDNV